MIHGGTLMAGPATRRRLGLLDLAALVVGYGLAALLVRAVWPPSRGLDPAVGVGLGLEYAWLGLAMSGPVVLLLDRRAPPPGGPAAAARGVRESRYTKPELVWLNVGAYWIAVTLVVAPARLNGGGFWSTVAAVQAILALSVGAYGLTAQPRVGEVAWTHRAAIGLILTWPLAWIDLILLSLT